MFFIICSNEGCVSILHFISSVSCCLFYIVLYNLVTCSEHLCMSCGLLFPSYWETFFFFVIGETGSPILLSKSMLHRLHLFQTTIFKSMWLEGGHNFQVNLAKILLQMYTCALGRWGHALCSSTGTLALPVPVFSAKESAFWCMWYIQSIINSMTKTILDLLVFTPQSKITQMCLTLLYKERFPASTLQTYSHTKKQKTLRN